MSKQRKSRQEKAPPVVAVAVALLVLTVAVYAPMLHSDFIDFDDRGYVVENAHVNTGLTWDNVKWALTAQDEANWHPLTWISHMIDVELYGLRAGGHHLTSLLLHSVNTVLLFAFLAWATGRIGPSAFASALFAIHPQHVESVAWVAERKDVLSTFFWMLALLAYVAYVRKEPNQRGKWYVATLVLFALGLTAKPMLVTLPFVLLLLDFGPLNRISWSTIRSDGPALIREKLPLFALSIVSSIVTFFVQRAAGSVFSLARLSINLRIANAAISYVAYIGSMIWPAKLAVFYPLPGSTPSVWLASVAALAGITFLVTLAMNKHRYLLTGWLWYLGTLIPVIGLVQVGTQARADRYTYIPFIGLFIIVAWGVSDFAARWQPALKALPVAACVVILASAIVARAQVEYWQTAYSLWKHAVEVTTNNATAQGHFGDALAKQGKQDEAIARYREAVKITRSSETLSVLGGTLAKQGKLEEAQRLLTEAVRLEPDYVDAHVNLGPVLALQGKLDEAAAELSQAVRLKPNDADAHKNLAVVLKLQGKLDEAVAQLQEAIRIAPANEQARQQLAEIRIQIGK